MNVVVTGSRHWADILLVEIVLTGIAELCAFNEDMLTVIQGGAPGADSIAKGWAERAIDVDSVTVPANWTEYGKAAGPIRNRKMIDEYRPDLVFAFHENLQVSRGTKDCVNYAREKGVAVYLFSSVL
jgi:hypothetical protein